MGYVNDVCGRRGAERFGSVTYCFGGSRGVVKLDIQPLTETKEGTMFKPGVQDNSSLWKQRLELKLPTFLF